MVTGKLHPFLWWHLWFSPLSFCSSYAPQSSSLSPWNQSSCGLEASRRHWQSPYWLHSFCHHHSFGLPFPYSQSCHPGIRPFWIFWSDLCAGFLALSMPSLLLLSPVSPSVRKKYWNRHLLGLKFGLMILKEVIRTEISYKLDSESFFHTSV